MNCFYLSAVEILCWVNSACGMIWLIHAFLWLKSWNYMNAARAKTITSKIRYWFHVDENVNTSGISGFAVQPFNRVLSCWITKGWRKATWVKFSASPVASTNQILIENILQVIKKASNQCLVTKKKITKNSGRKACLCAGGGVSNCRGR